MREFFAVVVVIVSVLFLTRYDEMLEFNMFYGVVIVDTKILFLFRQQRLNFMIPASFHPFVA